MLKDETKARLVAIESRHNGAMTGACGLREFNAAAHEDIEALLHVIHSECRDAINEAEAREVEALESLTGVRDAHEVTKKTLVTAEERIKNLRERLEYWTKRAGDAEAAMLAPAGDAAE